MFLVVVRQAGRLDSDALEDVVHERVHDAHGLAGDASVRVDLFQHLVDVDRVALFAGLPPSLAALTLGPSHGRRLLLSLLGGYFSGHDVSVRSLDCLNQGATAASLRLVGHLGLYFRTRIASAGSFGE